MNKVFPVFLGLTLAMTMPLLTGCDRLSRAAKAFQGAETEAPAEHGHGEGAHSHGAEGRSDQVTFFGDRFEVFLEHQLIVANKPVTFTTHLTDQQTLEPRREGPVDFILTLPNQQPIKQTVPAPARDGIYLPEFVIPVAGDWNLQLVVPLEGKNYTLDLPPFRVYASDAEARKAPEPPIIKGGISFLKEQQWKVLSKVEPVTKHTLTQRLQLAGVVNARPGNVALLTVPVAGKLLDPPDGKLPFVGDHVEAGQTIAMVEPPMAGSEMLSLSNNQNQIETMKTDLTVKLAETDAETKRSELALQKAQQALKRTKELYETKAKSVREVEEAEFNVKQAEASVESIAKLKTAYRESLAKIEARPKAADLRDGLPTIPIKSPIAGTVVEVNAAAGEHLSPEKMAIKIADTREVLIEAKVPEADLSRVNESIAATYELPGNRGTFFPLVGGEGKGRLVTIGSIVDASARTVPVIYELPNPETSLKLGMNVNVLIATAHTEQALAVPRTALVDEDGRPVAFVMVSGETFQKRDVKVGIQDGPMVQILSGLNEGEHVVTKEAYAVRLASLSTAIPSHGHVH